MAAPESFYTAPTSSLPSYDAAGSRKEVREYAPAKPEWLANADPQRLERLEQRMMTRAEDRSAPFPNSDPSKRRRAETIPSARFELTDVRHAVVEPFKGQIYIKIREFVHVKGKDFWSSPRGINLRVDEWKKLVEVMPAITEAVEDMEDFSFQRDQGSKKVKRDSDAQSDEATPDPGDGFPWGYTGDAVPYTKPSGTPEEEKEREACKDLAFNIIQAIFVPCILKKVDEICREQCYGCNLPIEKDFTQKNHECIMLDMSEKVEKFFDHAVDNILETELGKCRSEWNLTAKDNNRIVSCYSTIHARNRLFTKYVNMHVEKKVDEPENGRAVLYNICHADICFQQQMLV
ncbi:uncharacterized protein LOC119722554 [Patiria miniata]|uniref:Transcriptional coactivator p15 (PC4) C-terminal domain-containing protein n=1 Tax=Patiria miniata TaxID=46514 RepID=A0A913ZAA7_PATMI|nr:uncharacterized protein LOC119722554 [Patiria miniata]